MKEFNSLSGPWTGMSIQGGFRLMENLRLTIVKNEISGSGSDVDGEFEIAGTFDPANGAVRLERRYTWVAAGPSDGVGTPYEYSGHWDGAFVSGFWHQRDYILNNGPFEMWPNREEDQAELSLEGLMDREVTAHR